MTQPYGWSAVGGGLERRGAVLRPSPTQMLVGVHRGGQTCLVTSGCRLRIDDGPVPLAMLDGEPPELRRLAEVLRSAIDEVAVQVMSGEIVQRRTDSPLLRVSTSGRRLTIEGDANALGIVHYTLDLVAHQADSAQPRSGVREHAHVEYLGEGDQWRSPDSFPLVISADWPAEETE
jgi:hypothetical protein